MEEKKVIKISLSTFFLILAIIVIVVMGYFMYKLYNEKQQETEKVSSLNNQVGMLESAVGNLQGKIDSISNTINSNTKVENDDSETDDIASNKETKFSNDEIKKSLQEYLNLVGSKEGSPSNLLQKLNLLGDEIDYSDNHTTSDGYVKTNIKYLEYKNAMMNYVTEEWFNTKFTNGFKEENGLLYYFNGGGTGLVFEVKNIKNKENLTYIADVNVYVEEDTKELKSYEFAIDNYNGKCVISYCD